MKAPLTVFDDPRTLGEAAAQVLIRCLEEAGDRFVLGCPAGRTPLTTYRAFQDIAAARALDLSAMHLVLMDEYVTSAADGPGLCPADAHYSCRSFMERELRAPLNARLPAAKRLKAGHVHVPDPGAPAAYESLIGALGGVDMFLLASGASDGHVAFNPAGTPLGETTRVVALSETTRRDNLTTFPGFRHVDDIPRHGVSVGPGTIAKWSRAALLLLVGGHKMESFRRITAAEEYDPGWPASVVHACSGGMIFADRAAAGQIAPPEERVPCGR